MSGDQAGCPGQGATYRGGQDCCFSVWAPLCERVDLRLLTPQERLVPLRRTPQGYHEGEVDGVPPGSRPAPRAFRGLTGVRPAPRPRACYIAFHQHTKLAPRRQTSPT